MFGKTDLCVEVDAFRVIEALVLLRQQQFAQDSPRILKIYSIYLFGYFLRLSLLL